MALGCAMNLPNIGSMSDYRKYTGWIIKDGHVVCPHCAAKAAAKPMVAVIVATIEAHECPSQREIEIEAEAMRAAKQAWR